MKRQNKNILIILSIGIVLIVSMFFVFNKTEEDKELPKVKLKNQNKPQQFALMLEQDNGEYKESEGDLPTEGYVFNKEKSGCTDVNGKVVEDALDYDYDNYTVLLDTSKTLYCYLYYDIEPNISYLRSNDNGKFLSKNMQGGMYRYQGLYTDDVRNYICLGDNCCNTTECDADNNDDMYRIIGINAKGELKVIKKTALTDAVQWWSDETADIKWPQSLTYQKLNGKSEDGTTRPNLDDTNSYYYSLNSELKKLIVNNHSWLYGDMLNYNNYNGSTIYEVEIGKSDATYFNKDDGDGIPTGKYKWNEKLEAPLGLMYISDYVYAYKTSDKDAGNPGSVSNAVSSWIHLSHNQSTDSAELLMIRAGFLPRSDWNSYVVIRLSTGWGIGWGRLHGKDSLRPTFYLVSSVELDGEGTLSNPFKIKY